MRHRRANDGAAGARHAADRRCPHCGGRTVTRFGRTPQGAQRWHCHDCGRKYQATTKTTLAGLHRPDKFAALLADMLGPRPSSCRALACRLKLDKTTVWQWRQKASDGFACRSRPPLAEPCLAAVTILRESRKASREWVNHRRYPLVYPAPDRLRWVDYRRLGLTPPDHLPRYRIPVVVTIDRAGRLAAGVRTSDTPERADIASPPTPLHPATSAAPSPQPALPRTMPPDPDSAARAAAAFRRFLKPFRGPATRHLKGYVAWFVERANGISTGRVPGRV